MQALKLLVPFTGMVTPNAMIMGAMGWTNVAHFVLLGTRAIFSTA